MADPALDAVSIARLHGEACWDCGAVATTLHPAGSVTTENGKEWLIVKCEKHRERPICRLCQQPIAAEPVRVIRHSASGVRPDDNEHPPQDPECTPIVGGTLRRRARRT